MPLCDCSYLFVSLRKRHYCVMTCMESNHLRIAMALSAAGMLLMPVFGLLLRFQPQYVNGLHSNTSNAEFNCYIVGGLYGGVFLISNLLFSLKTRGCFDKKQKEAHDDIGRRNQRFNLPFMDLESKEVAKAMDDMDRRTAVVPPFMDTAFKRTLDLPTKFPCKVDTV